MCLLWITVEENKAFQSANIALKRCVSSFIRAKKRNSNHLRYVSFKVRETVTISLN